jgi:hypothetical protein
MNIADAKQQVKDTVEAYLAVDEVGMHRIEPAAQRPLFLIGAPGIGKTAIMSQVANELGIGLVSYSMTHHTRQSALGLPFVVDGAHGGLSYKATEYTMSEIIASIYDYMEQTGLERGILFLDEINCVSETLYPSMLQFLQFKTFGRHRVPDNWIVVCAGNPPEYNKSAREFDIVTLDRVRKIDVEPDFDSWKAYALGAGVHPSILSFLEIEQDCFYAVESTPTGKRFVSARGWTDLSRTLATLEDMGKTVDVGLIEQFVQDASIAERFAVYYELFSKYRSDYQIGAILGGSWTPDVEERAQQAAFDERLAVLNLILDAIEAQTAEALEREAVVIEVRDVLRTAKSRIVDGESAGAVLDEIAMERTAELETRMSAGTLPPSDVRLSRLTIEQLRKLERTGAAAGGGAEAFDTLSEAYAQLVVDMQQLSEGASSQLENAFAFVEQTFGNEREMLVFVSDLSTRPTTMRFINTFGSDGYALYSERLAVQEHRNDLLARASELAL